MAISVIINMLINEVNFNCKTREKINHTVSHAML